MSLFAQSEEQNLKAVRPLAARMRPGTLDEFVGQKHFLGQDKLLWRLIKSDQLGSMIFTGPPGCGKTTLAQLLATETKRRFVQLSALHHGVKELREQLQIAKDEIATGGPSTLLFIDEIHRFNRAQQDAMLSHVEEGIVSLVGATTSNPFFAVNNALVSRSRIFQFEPLSKNEIVELLKRSLADSQRGLGIYKVQFEDDAIDYLADVSDGDARQALATLEVAVLSSSDRPVVLDRQSVRDSLMKRAVQYDATGDEHYDCASALIKSIRGSDPDAGIYWLARMLEGGEDVRFLCRRLVILASEDIGNADPHALTLAVACFQACEQVGLPECQLTLSQTVAFLACAPKSNAATTAIGEARSDIKNARVLPVPRHLRDGHYSGAKQFGHGEGYKYSHNSSDGIAEQDYLGVERIYYKPVDRGFESELLKRLELIRKKLNHDNPGDNTKSTDDLTQ